jgi:hypothetical protein
MEQKSMEEQRKDGDIMHNKLRLKIMYDQEGKCADCGIEEWRLMKRLNAHRILTGRDGGKYLYGNVILLCSKCHYRRHHEQR